MARIKKRSKKYAIGGNLAGNLDTTGITNNEINKNHIYLNSGERTLAGIAQGLGSAIGIGGLIQASNDAMGVSDQLNKSKEYKTATGITGGIASLGMNAVNMIGKGMGNTPKIDSPNTDIQNPGFVTPNLSPDNSSVEVTDLTMQNNIYNPWNQAFGGKMKYAFGGKWVPPASDETGGTTINGVYYSPQDLALLTQFEASNSIDPNTGQSFKVFSNEDDFKNSYNPVRRMDNALLAAKAWETSLPIDKKNYFDPVVTNKGTLQGGDANKFRNTNQVESMENTYSKKNKFKANGGSLGLSEANGGFIHEDPNPMNVNQGVPINNQATVEVGETIFNPENYVFSDRIKVPGGKGTFADLSKKIKNKYKLRPDDKLSKEAINQDLKTLMNQQETIKREQAAKLMQKAIELDPNMLQQMQPQNMQPQQFPNGGEIEEPYIAYQGPKNKPFLKRAAEFVGDLGVQDLSNWFMSNTNQYQLPATGKLLTAPAVDINYQLYTNPNKPIDSKLKFANGGDIEPPKFTPDNTYEDINLVDYNYPISNPDEIIGINRKQYPIPTGLNNNITLGSGPITPDTQNEDTLNTKLLSTTKMPMDYSGINAGILGLQSAGEAMRLALTPNSRLTGNVNFDRVNPYSAIANRKKAGQEALASAREGLKNYLSPSQYIAAMTGSVGDISQATGMDTAALDLQAKSLNAQTQMREAMANKELERERNNIIDQDIANRSNQLGAVAAGAAQNAGVILRDKSARDMDLYSLQFMNKDNYKLITTEEEAEKYGQPKGSYIFVPSGYQTKTSKIKKKYKG